MLAMALLDPALGFAFARRTNASVPTQNGRTSLVTQKLLHAGITFLNTLWLRARSGGEYGSRNQSRASGTCSASTRTPYACLRHARPGERRDRAQSHEHGHRGAGGGGGASAATVARALRVALPAAAGGDA